MKGIPAAFLDTFLTKYCPYLPYCCVACVCVCTGASVCVCVCICVCPASPGLSNALCSVYFAGALHFVGGTIAT